MSAVVATMIVVSATTAAIVMSTSKAKTPGAALAIAANVAATAMASIVTATAAMLAVAATIVATVMNAASQPPCYLAYSVLTQYPRPQQASPSLQ